MNKMAGFAIAGAVAAVLGASAMGMVGTNFGNMPSNAAEQSDGQGITGTVVDADGQPVADAIVTVLNPDQGAFSDECHEGGSGGVHIGGGGTTGAANAGRFARTDKHGHFNLATNTGKGTTNAAGVTIVGRKKGVGTGTTTTNGTGKALIKLRQG